MPNLTGLRNIDYSSLKAELDKSQRAAVGVIENVRCSCWIREIVQSISYSHILWKLWRKEKRSFCFYLWFNNIRPHL